MFHAQKSSWQSNIGLEVLQARAKLLASVRNFFAQHNFLEVDTPIWSEFAITNPYVHPVAVQINSANRRLGGYLQTSPEYAMKRLLASGSGSIYQLGKVFRDHDLSRLHLPEFTLLEWYQLGDCQQRAINLVDNFLQQMLGCCQARVISYRELFEEHLNINPHQAAMDALRSCMGNDISPGVANLDNRADILSFLFVSYIEPLLAASHPWIIIDYPECCAELAQTVVRSNGDRVALRFEVYYRGIELANAYVELLDHVEQLARFEQDNIIRKHQNLPEMPIDTRLIAALKHGVPPCTGVALGFDRLLMLQLGKQSIDEVVAFT